MSVTTRSRTRIKDFARHVGEQVLVCGWVTHSRRKGKICFVVLRDGTGTCQLVASVKDVDDATFGALDKVGQEAAVHARGTLKADPRAPGGYEVLLSAFEVVDYHLPIFPEPLPKKRQLTVTPEKTLICPAFKFIFLSPLFEFKVQN